jgi:hypothetical protein
MKVRIAASLLAGVAGAGWWAHAQTVWPAPVPMRLKPSGHDDILVTTLGDVRTPLADATFDPLADTVTTTDGRTIAHYYRDTLQIPYYAPIDKTRYPLPPSGWSSWYYYYQEVTSDEVVANAEWIATHLAPYGAWLVQLDDGWQGVGHGNNNNRDWTTIDARFRDRGMAGLAKAITDRGLKAGIWIAPHGQSNPQVVRASNAFLLKPDGSSASDSWEGNYLIDPSSPQALTYLTDLFKRLRGWGYTYFKIDGQPTVVREYGRHFGDGAAENLYRRTLPAIRAGIGSDSYLLGCWGIPLAAMGYVNGSRTAGDVLQSHQGFLIAAIAMQEWNFLHNIAWYSDPDVLEVRPPLSDGTARSWATLMALTGQALMDSDRVMDLPPSRVELLRRIYPATDIRPLDLYRPDNVLKPIVDLKVHHLDRQYDVVGLFNYEGDAAVTHHLRWRDLGLDPRQAYHVYDFWSGVYLGAWEDGVFIDVPPSDVRVLTLMPAADRPVLLSTSRHLTQGWVDLMASSATGTALSGQSRVIAGDPYRLVFGLPLGADTRRIASIRVVDASGGAVDAEYGNHQGYATVTVRPASTGTVSWTVDFAPAHIYSYPVQSPNQILATAEGLGGIAVRWRTESHVRAAYRVELDGVPLGVAFEPHATLHQVPQRPEHRVAVRSVWTDGSVASGAAEVTLAGALERVVALGDVEPSFVRQDTRNLWRRLGANRSVDGRALTIGGERFASGVGSHAGWDVHYALDGMFARLTARVGVDDEVRRGQKAPNEIAFEVWGDGRLLWQSGVRHSGEPAAPLSVDVSGVRDLVLKALPGSDGFNDDHADWAEARVERP